MKFTIPQGNIINSLQLHKVYFSNFDEKTNFY